MQATSSNGTSPSAHTEHHTPKFRGIWIPAEIHYLVYEGKLTTTEAWLLATIDSLVDARGEGCWASNQYLADRLGGLRADHVKGLIKHLKELGLVKQVGWKMIGHLKHRVLETAWSRVDICTYGGDTSPGYGGDKTPDPPNANRTSMYSVKNTQLPPSAGNGEINTSSTNGHVHSTNGHATPKTPETPPATKLARKLHHGLSTKGKIVRQPNMASWIKAFRELLQHRKQPQIERAIDQYIEHIDEEYWPQLFSGTSFCREFPRVEAAIKRQKKREGTAGDGYRTERVKVGPHTYRTRIVKEEE